MLILPSVGSKVIKIVLSKNATKAKLYFSDGSATIVGTNGTATTPNVVKKSVAVRSIVKKPVKKVRTENVGFKTVNTKTGMINVPVVRDAAKLEQMRVSALERAKARTALLEQEAMTPSERAGIQAAEGQQVQLS